MPLIKIEDVAYVRFAAPNLELMRRFLSDFGFVSVEDGTETLYARGAGPAPFLHATEPGEPGFVALGLRAPDRDALERLASAEGAPIKPLDAPGGGLVVSLRDPDGFHIDVVAGQEPGAPVVKTPASAWNNADHKPRQGSVKRTGAGPATVIRLGHCVLNVSDFRASERWYKERFGFITSDEIQLGPDQAIGAFLRCDRGDQPTDHHTLFLAQSPKGPGFNHAAFEVRDMDDLMRGHGHLMAAGWNPAWGVGRHLLGSQVFDYWRDPFGNAMEHWTDGDLFTAQDGSNTASIQDLLAVQWGPPMPPTFA